MFIFFPFINIYVYNSPNITKKRESHERIDFRNYLFNSNRDLWFDGGCAMSSITLTINDLTVDEKSQIFDLFVLVDIFPTSQHDPINNTHNVVVGINDSDGRTLDGVMAYLLKHIIKN